MYWTVSENLDLNNSQDLAMGEVQILLTGQLVVGLESIEKLIRACESLDVYL